MKKLLLILLCVPLMFSCGDKTPITKPETKNGQGTGTYNGDKYVGEFLNNYRHGQGTMTYANGDKYVGEWNYNNKHGQGTMTYSNGGVVKGLWKDNQLISQE